MTFLQQLLTGAQDVAFRSSNYLVYILMIILGFILILKGSAIFRIWLTLAGLGSGYRLGITIAEWADLDGAGRWVLVAVLAVLIALLYALALKISFFLAGISSGYYLAWALAGFFNIDIHILVAILVAILVGFFAAAMRYHFIMIATAATGALLLIDAVVGVIRKVEPFTVIWQEIEQWKIGQSLTLLILTIALTLFGYMLQSGRIRHR